MGVRLRHGVHPGCRHFHVRRAQLLPRCEAEVERCSRDQGLAARQQVHHRRRARLERSRLPLGLCLRAVWRPWCLRGCHHALLGQGRHQHLPGWICAHGELEIQRGCSAVQGERERNGGGGEEDDQLRLPDHVQDPRHVQDQRDSEILVLLGENGTGKTTFIRMMAGKLEPDSGSGEVPALNISFKPQKTSPKHQGTTRQLLHDRIRDAYVHPQFVADVMRPLKIDDIIDQEVQNLSGGELQRVALALCLGKPADVYLIDEPSAYLDSEQRLVAAKVIKRFILHAKKTGFVVEHDFIMATYLADRVIVFEGSPSVETTANSPQALLGGMNKFLGQLSITFRRDPNNYRPRINKLNSVKDCEQKLSGNYFFLED